MAFVLFCAMQKRTKKRSPRLLTTHYFLNSKIQQTHYAKTALDFFRIFKKRVSGCHSQGARESVQDEAFNKQLCCTISFTLSFIFNFFDAFPRIRMLTKPSCCGVGKNDLVLCY